MSDYYQSKSNVSIVGEGESLRFKVKASEEILNPSLPEDLAKIAIHLSEPEALWNLLEGGHTADNTKNGAVRETLRVMNTEQRAMVLSADKAVRTLVRTGSTEGGLMHPRQVLEWMLPMNADQRVEILCASDAQWSFLYCGSGRKVLDMVKEMNLEQQDRVLSRGGTLWNPCWDDIAEPGLVDNTTFARASDIKKAIAAFRAEQTGQDMSLPRPAQKTLGTHASEMPKP